MNVSLFDAARRRGMSAGLILADDLVNALCGESSGAANVSESLPASAREQNCLAKLILRLAHLDGNAGHTFQVGLRHLAEIRHHQPRSFRGKDEREENHRVFAAKETVAPANLTDKAVLTIPKDPCSAP